MSSKIPKEDEEKRRAKGINAIIYLQQLVGIEETREKAGAGWDAMTEHERASTLSLAEQYRGEDDW